MTDRTKTWVLAAAALAAGYGLAAVDWVLLPDRFGSAVARLLFHQ